MHTSRTDSRCAYCGRLYDRKRVIGWALAYCQPMCEKRALDAEAARFARFWEGE
jgi:hypothetical protein